MDWTKEKPTQTGWYWWNYSPGAAELVRVVGKYIFIMDIDGGEPLREPISKCGGSWAPAKPPAFK